MLTLREFFQRVDSTEDEKLELLGLTDNFFISCRVDFRQVVDDVATKCNFELRHTADFGNVSADLNKVDSPFDTLDRVYVHKPTGVDVQLFNFIGADTQMCFPKYNFDQFNATFSLHHNQRHIGERHYLRASAMCIRDITQYLVEKRAPFCMPFADVDMKF